ncbi:hypothetical protein [Aeromonas veronii]|uniref:hypothetical protein n=1 Tax=Aeromonas veronii TaxID=654 RepID=UPI0015D06FAB|nr:hypothetical protein [Aeromonas veronii]QLH66828.1 hypothetical protein HXV88_10410 [Aeromonas veronii]
MESIQYNDLENGKLKQLISQRKSFEVRGLSGRMDSAVTYVEREIESSGLSCRIYLYGRVAAAGASVFGGVTGLLGIASAVGMVAHNLATYDPDYEIAKHKIDNKLTVTFKR